VDTGDHHQIGVRGTGHPRERALRFAAALGAALLFASVDVGATEVAGAELLVERDAAASDCPDAIALAKATLALGSPPAARGEPLQLIVRFERGLDGYTAVIEATGRKQGTRELHHPAASCRPLADAASVVLAVLSDLIPAPAPEPEAQPQPAPVPPPPPPPPAPRPTAAIGLESGLAYGLVGSAVTGTASVVLRARYQAAELELGALFGLPHYQPVGPGVLETSLVAGTALGCWWFGGENRLALGGCAGPALGSLQGSGHGYDHDDSARPLWFAAVFGLAARVPIRSRWTCRLALSAVVPFNSHTFLVDPLQDGFHSTPAAVWLRFGPEYRFW
jgi:hypothetical protein